MDFKLNQRGQDLKTGFILPLTAGFLLLAAGCREAPELADETTAPDAAPAPQARYNLQGTNVVTQGATSAPWQNGADELGLWDGATAEDKTLARRVHIVLSTEMMGVTGAVDVSFLNKNVRVLSENGVVTLQGRVRSEKEKIHMEEVAADLEGVKQVRNELQVDPSVPVDSIRDEIQQFTED